MVEHVFKVILYHRLLGMVSRYAGKNPSCLVKLYGCCMEEDQLLLIYEYMENNSLAHALFGNCFSLLSSLIYVSVIMNPILFM